MSKLCGEKEKVRYLVTTGEMEGERTRGRQIILALRLELVIAYKVAGDYSFCASVTV